MPASLRPQPTYWLQRGRRARGSQTDAPRYADPLGIATRGGSRLHCVCVWMCLERAWARTLCESRQRNLRLDAHAQKPAKTLAQGFVLASVDGLGVLLEGGRQGRTTENCQSSPRNRQPSCLKRHATAVARDNKRALKPVANARVNKSAAKHIEIDLEMQKLPLHAAD
jgi:hypothetical protein